MLSIQDPARDISRDQVEQFIGAPGQDCPDCVEGEALCLLGGDRRRDRQLLTCDHDVDERGSVVRERVGQRALELARLVDTTTEAIVRMQLGVVHVRQSRMALHMSRTGLGTQRNHCVREHSVREHSIREQSVPEPVPGPATRQEASR